MKMVIYYCKFNEMCRFVTTVNVYKFGQLFYLLLVACVVNLLLLF